MKERKQNKFLEEDKESKKKERFDLLTLSTFTPFKSHPFSVLSAIKLKTLSEAGDISIPTTLKRFLSFRLLPLATRISDDISIHPYSLKSSTL